MSSDDNRVAPTKFCRLCKRIDLAANIENLKKLGRYSPRKRAAGWVLGTLAHILLWRTKCQLCALLHFLVTKRFREQRIELEKGFEVALEWTNDHFVKGQVVVVVVRVGEARWITLNDAFEPTCAIPGSDMNEVSPPPTRPATNINRIFELRHIEDKLRTCDAHHRHHCQRNSQRAEVVPLFLIDTQKLCLVRSDTSSQYFTLSYRWGQIANAGLTRANVEALTRPRGLREIWPKISRVVREAIQLVAQIGVYAQRYLWVDSLCILQDDAEHKHSQISHMGMIYHQAAMTIVALSAVNADSELVTSSEDFCESEYALGDVERQKHVRLVPDYRISTSLIEHADRQDYIYRSRGWTFQEEKLSRRVLYCTDSGMLFRCRVLLGHRPWWDDDWCDKTATRENMRTEVVKKWQDLVMEYSRRHFTYPSDTLRGFTGIADTLNHPGGGEMSLHVVCGVSLECFPYSLYWERKELEKQKRHYSFPTWSWASYEGAVVFPDASIVHASNVYQRHGNEAELVGSPIPLEIGDDVLQVDGDGASFDDQRCAIRELASAALALDIRRQSNTWFFKQPVTMEVDKFFMLRMRVRREILEWSDLGLTVTKNSTSHSRFDAILWPGRNGRLLSYDFYREDDLVGSTDVAPEVFKASKEDSIVFIPLFEIPNVVFLVARCVGNDLYERLGVAWECNLPFRSKQLASNQIVYLI